MHTIKVLLTVLTKPTSHSTNPWRHRRSYKTTCAFIRLHPNQSKRDKSSSSETSFLRFLCQNLAPKWAVKWRHTSPPRRTRPRPNYLRNSGSWRIFITRSELFERCFNVDLWFLLLCTGRCLFIVINSVLFIRVSG